jgi:hypothetical protein
MNHNDGDYDDDHDTAGSLGGGTIQTTSTIASYKSLSSSVHIQKMMMIKENHLHRPKDGAEDHQAVAHSSTEKNKKPAATMTTTTTDHSHQKKQPAMYTPPQPMPPPLPWSVRPYLTPPSLELLRAYCQSAIRDDPHSDQSLLQYGAAILSFRDVIFPAVCEQHVLALAQVNGVAKRDDRPHAHHVKTVRVAFLKAVGTTLQQMKDEQPSYVISLLQQCAAARQKMTAPEEQQPQTATIDPKELAKLRREYNQETWEEIAELIKAKNELEKEKAKWDGINEQLDAKLKRLQKAETERLATMETEPKTTAIINKTKEDELLERIHNAAIWLRVSATRITEGLPSARQLIAQTEQHRAQLYESYEAASTMDWQTPNPPAQQQQNNVQPEEPASSSPPPSAAAVVTMDLVAQAFGGAIDDDEEEGDQSMEALDM